MLRINKRFIKRATAFCRKFNITFGSGNARERIKVAVITGAEILSAYAVCVICRSKFDIINGLITRYRLIAVIDNGAPFFAVKIVLIKSVLLIRSERSGTVEYIGLTAVVYINTEFEISGILAVGVTV